MSQQSANPFICVYLWCGPGKESRKWCNCSCFPTWGDVVELGCVQQCVQKPLHKNSGSYWCLVNAHQLAGWNEALIVLTDKDSKSNSISRQLATICAYWIYLYIYHYISYIIYIYLICILYWCLRSPFESSFAAFAQAGLAETKKVEDTRGASSGQCCNIEVHSGYIWATF